MVQLSRATRTNGLPRGPAGRVEPPSGVAVAINSRHGKLATIRAVTSAFSESLGSDPLVNAFSRQGRGLSSTAGRWRRRCGQVR